MIEILLNAILVGVLILCIYVATRIVIDGRRRADGLSSAIANSGNSMKTPESLSAQVLEKLIRETVERLLIEKIAEQASLAAAEAELRKTALEKYGVGTVVSNTTSNSEVNSRDTAASYGESSAFSDEWATGRPVLTRIK